MSALFVVKHFELVKFFLQVVFADKQGLIQKFSTNGSN